MDENNAVSVLEELIETSKDGHKGYQDAASHAKRPDLKTYFNQQSLERGGFAQELQAEVAGWANQIRKYPVPFQRRFIAPGSTQKSVWVVVIKRSLNRLRRARTMPRKPTGRR